MLYVFLAILAVLVLISLLGLAWQRDAIRELERDLEALSARPAERYNELKAEIAAQGSVVDALRDSMRRQFGNVYKRLGGAAETTSAESPSPTPAGDFEALIALQSAPPPKNVQ